MKKLLCFLGFHRWSKDINEKYADGIMVHREGEEKVFVFTYGEGKEKEEVARIRVPGKSVEQLYKLMKVAFGIEEKKKLNKLRKRV